MATRKAGKPAFNRTQFNLLLKRVADLEEELRQKVNLGAVDRSLREERAEALRVLTERLETENEELKKMVEKMVEVELRREADFEQLATESSQFLCDARSFAKELDDLEKSKATLQKLANDSHAALIRHSNDVLDSVELLKEAFE